jgi:hypothetical protein
MYQLKYTPPADGFCVSTALANLSNSFAPISEQIALGYTELTISEAAAYFGVFFEPIIAGVPIHQNTFGAIIQQLAQTANNAYYCVGVQMSHGSPQPESHFCALLVGRAYIFGIDAKSSQLTTFATHLCDRAFLAHGLDKATGLYLQYDIVARAPKLYQNDEIQHLFSVN